MQPDFTYLAKNVQFKLFFDRVHQSTNWVDELSNKFLSIKPDDVDETFVDVISHIEKKRYTEWKIYSPISTLDDFKSLYNEEFKKSKRPDTELDHINFKRTFIEKLEKGLTEYKHYFEKQAVSVSDESFYSLVEHFIKFIKTGMPINTVTNNAEIQMGSNTFDRVSLDKIHKHFTEMLVEPEFMSNVDLVKFIEAAFVNGTKKREFSVDSKYKQEVYRAFYTYYKNVAGSPSKRKRDYASLLGEYFFGYSTDTVFNNFSRSK